MAWSEFLFWVMAVSTGVGALAIVLSRDIVHAAVWLLFTLLSVGGLFFLLGAAFVGTVQLLVYVGGTLVLLVFGVMLTARVPMLKIQTSSGEWIVALVAALLMLMLVLVCVFTTPWTVDTGRLAALTEADDPADDSPSTLIGQALLTKYLLPFEIISVHLVVVLVGAAYLARARGRQAPGVPVPRAGDAP